LNPTGYSRAGTWRQGGQYLTCIWPLLLLALYFVAALPLSQCLAQGVHHPFAVGINEGAVGAQGIGGWILGQEAGFYRLLSGAIRAAKQSGAAAWGLAGLSLAYGIFHAAGLTARL
jgi:nickel/cobalt transporter (NicO) family protein